MRKTWKLSEYKEHLWKCATATTIPEFEHYMSEFSFYDNKACEWLRKIPAKHWARSHFTGTYFMILMHLKVTIAVLLILLCIYFEQEEQYLIYY